LSVVCALRASWLMAILPIFVASLPFPKLAPYSKLLTGFSRRGKTMQSSSHKLSVPQKYFFHFYILGVIWTTLLLITTWLYAYKSSSVVSGSITDHFTGGSNESSVQNYSGSHKKGIWHSILLLLLMETQLLRRLSESIHVFKYSPSARMHIVGYLTGLFFYAAAPLSLCCEYATEVLKLMIKGKEGMQIEELNFWGHVLVPLMHLKWYAWIGAVCFIWGWIHQFRCHAILGSLRENGSSHEGDYVIPHGDWFEYVSSPHYLAEIVIYGGFVIGAGLSDVTVWLLFVFVVTNLAFAAADAHEWYIRKFDNYPRDRRLILPFIY
ncbi:hypothetical protein M569_06704, partial [Genlisea aurea]